MLGLIFGTLLLMTLSKQFLNNVSGSSTKGYWCIGLIGGRPPAGAPPILNPPNDPPPPPKGAYSGLPPIEKPYPNDEEVPGTGGGLG